MKKYVLLTMQWGMVMCLYGQTLTLPKGLNPGASNERAAANINPNVPALCDACDPKLVKINVLPAYSIQFLNDQSFSLGQSINISTSPYKLIRSIKAELSYFEYLPENENCLTCNTNSVTFGNFNSGSTANVNGSGAGTHELSFQFTPPKQPGNFPMSMVITMPPSVNCCEGVVRICIRYTVLFDDCTACSRVVCYERKKGSNVISDHSNPHNAKSR